MRREFGDRRIDRGLIDSRLVGGLPGLVVLSLNECGIEDTGIGELLKVLRDARAVRDLQRLYLRSNPADEELTQAAYKLLTTTGRGRTTTPDGATRMRPEDIERLKPPVLVTDRGKPVYTVQRPPTLEELNPVGEFLASPPI